MMENHYHEADPFRWYLNAFLRALKEIPDLIQMAAQNEASFVAWFREQRKLLASDPLIDVLYKKRNLIVHRTMLLPNSKCTVGITEGRGFKMAMTAHVNPLEDSDKALLRYASHKKDFDFLGLTTPDEDSVPCIYREWRLEGLEEELVDLCARAWLRVGETVASVLRWQGAEPPPLSLECRHDSQRIRLKLLDRDSLIEQMNAVQNQPSVSSAAVSKTGGPMSGRQE